MEKINIAIADDHPIIYDGLASLLGRFKEINVVFTACNGEEVLSKLKTQVVDVLLLDLDMPKMDGEETLSLVSQKYPEVKVIIFTTYFNPSFVLRFIKMNVPAIVSKTWPIQRIVDAIKAVYVDGDYIDESVYKILKRSITNGPEIKDTDLPNLNLNTLEVQIIKLICTGHTTAEIANKLNRAPKTIDWHRNIIWRNTGVPSGNIPELTLYAIKNRLVSLL